MKEQSILDHSSATLDAAQALPVTSAIPYPTASVSAGIADVTAHPPKISETRLRFPTEDGGRSLAEMASSDLDAALQLLAERAQYITGASGAAIALRRGQNRDMLCRASAGSNAPELGTLLSMDHGLSGESVRTRQALRCDDAERDPRVNREGCRQLGIASVVIMPIVSNEQAIGVFELFSGKPRAFDERDLCALQRLSEMIEIAVKCAAGPPATAMDEAYQEGLQFSVDPVTIASAEIESATPANFANTSSSSSATSVNNLPRQESEPIKEASPDENTPKPTPKKPLFWSAAMQTQASKAEADQPVDLVVPPVLRSLQKCEACGFPVSQGRTFCVECEEKQWREEAGPQVDALAPSSPLPVLESRDAATVPHSSAELTRPTGDLAPAADELVFTSPEAPAPAADVSCEELASLNNSVPFLANGIRPESWFAANKYIFGALLLLAAVVSAIASLR